MGVNTVKQAFSVCFAAFHRNFFSKPLSFFSFNCCFGLKTKQLALILKVATYENA